MPLYDLQCENCAHQFEAVIKLEDKDKTVYPCPKCDGPCKQLPAGTKSYKIKGDNSASVTPKKFR